MIYEHKPFFSVEFSLIPQSTGSVLYLEKSTLMMMIVYMCEIEVYVFSAHPSTLHSKASPTGKRGKEENEKLNMQKRN